MCEFGVVPNIALAGSDNLIAVDACGKDYLPAVEEQSVQLKRLIADALNN